ncbi:meckelin-like [Uloborus diversus]|uniref:meckelin-like n=1 Tax=Uloborus diversus TaxID=327109 RepID=UPI00240918A2|nr:meckelin-like [Uloborus diversus]
MTQMVIFSLILFSFVNVMNGNVPLPAITPEFCNATEYYDPICVRCRKCGREDTQMGMQLKAHDGSCACKSHYYTKARKGPHDVTCAACPAGTQLSIDGSNCLECPKSNPYNETIGGCEPCINGTLVEDGENITCIPCQNSIRDENDGTRYSVCSNLNSVNAKYCAQINMIYSGGFCLPTVHSETSLVTIKFQNGETVQSAFLKAHLNAALSNCKENNDTACQVLANMCVMLMYKFSIENNACSEFRKLADKRLEECPKQKLWLYYIGETIHGNAVKELNRGNVPNVFAPYPALEASKLHIYAMKYALNGTFIGISKLTSDDINLCPEAGMHEDLPFIFGTHVERTCSVSLQKLWTSSDMVFYDLYLANKSNKTEFYPIPVLIKSINVNGELVNAGDDKTKWWLVRRFFLTDHISGIQDGVKLVAEHNQPYAKVFRYAARVSLKIRMKTQDKPGTIFPPLLIISYAEAVPDDYMRNKRVTVQFSVSYERNQGSVMKGVTIAICVLGGLSFFWSCLQTWSWFRRSGKHAIDLLTLGKFIVYMSGNLATVFFFVIFCVCLNWFIFFKKQDVIHTLLPTPEQVKFVSVYIGLAFAMKTIELIHLLCVQCTINIFFIDWERPRVRASTTSARNVAGPKNVAESSMGGEGKKIPGIAKGTPDKINTEMAGISIWRTYFAANEWTEIQSKRKLSLSVQVFGVLFFLKVLDFEKFASSGPSFDIPSSDVNQLVPYSSCCRFALGASIYISLALIQVIVQKAVYERFIEDKLQQYVDLCSVSNISVFILLTKRFGYYIHGRSAHGKADVNMKEMHEFLRKEEEDLCGHRGLLPDTEQQTFQMILPSGVHDQFLRLLVPLTSYSQAADRMQGVGGRLAKVDIDRVANTHYMLNKFLSGFIEHSFKDLDYVVKDKVLLENIFDVECYEVADRGYFYNDDGRSFSSVLFYGNETVLLLFDVLLFSVIDLASSDFVLAAVLTFIFAKIIQAIRQSAGRRNLVRKALVDERFLT